MFHVLVQFVDGRTVEGVPDDPRQIGRLIGDRVAGKDDVPLTFGDLPRRRRTGDVHRVEITF